MKKIKVLEMINQPFLGGGQRHLLSLAKGLDKKKFEVFVCSRDGGPLIDELKRYNIQFFPVSFRKRISGEIVREITSILVSNRIDILHTHGGVAGLYGRWAARKSRLPAVIHTLHGIHYLHYRNLLLRYFYILLERYFSRFTDALIFVSEADRKRGKRLKLIPEEKMYIIPNGIDLSVEIEELKDLRANKSRELGFEDFDPIIGTVARLHRQKGIIYLLRAAKRIHEEYPRSKILIIGGGSLRSKLEKSARKLGVRECVLFMGERKDVQELFSLFDVFVLPSLWEGLPYVLMEASTFGMPVVATDINGTREMVRNGESGILIPPKNPEELAQAVIFLLQDRDYGKRLGEAMRREIPSKYTISQMLEKVQNLYIELINKAHRNHDYLR